MPASSLIAMLGCWNVVSVPGGVMRPIWSVSIVNQRLPSGPAVMAPGSPTVTGKAVCAVPEVLRGTMEPGADGGGT